MSQPLAEQSPRRPAPLVAIVTPVYNGAEFLDDTMRSVQAQTYPNIVHVVLDNASTDATPEIIKAYRDAKVKLIAGRNDKLLTMDENWNAALALIPPEAQYFRILCADDTIMPEATEKMVALAEAHPEVSVVTTAGLRNDKPSDFLWPRDREIFDGDEAIRKLFTLEGVLEARQMLWRREALKSASPFFDLHVGQNSDLDAGLRVLAPGKLGFLHEPLIMIREHEGNTTNSAMRPLRIHFNDWLIMLRRHGPRAFGDRFPEMEGRYRRYYFRQILKWRYKFGDRKVFDHHMELLGAIGTRPSFFGFADSMLDWPLIRLGLRKGWYSYPS
jgi:glycosyltransferase involved in cell wall biosynthesis